METRWLARCKHDMIEFGKVRLGRVTEPKTEFSGSLTWQNQIPGSLNDSDHGRRASTSPGDGLLESRNLITLITLTTGRETCVPSCMTSP